jgi:hypothetical protein
VTQLTEATLNPTTLDFYSQHLLHFIISVKFAFTIKLPSVLTCCSPNDTSALDPVELCSTLLAAVKTPLSMVNHTDKSGQTPLHLAARRGAGICATYMIKVNSKDVSSWWIMREPIGVRSGGHSSIYVHVVLNCEKNRRTNWLKQPNKFSPFSISIWDGPNFGSWLTRVLDLLAQGRGLETCATYWQLS